MKYKDSGSNHPYPSLAVEQLSQMIVKEEREIRRSEMNADDYERQLEAELKFIDSAEERVEQMKRAIKELEEELL